MKELPRTLSGLLRVAVRDAQAAEVSGVTLDMGVWISSYGAGCSACMAGAVMLQLDREKALCCICNPSVPFQFAQKTGVAHLETMLYAVDDMRQGEMFSAYNNVYGGELEPTEEQEVALENAARIIGCEYDVELMLSPWKTYLQAADELEKAGL